MELQELFLVLYFLALDGVTEVMVGVMEAGRSEIFSKVEDLVLLESVCMLGGLCILIGWVGVVGKLRGLGSIFMLEGSEVMLAGSIAGGSVAGRSIVQGSVADGDWSVGEGSILLVSVADGDVAVLIRHLEARRNKGVTTPPPSPPKKSGLLTPSDPLV